MPNRAERRKAVAMKHEKVVHLSRLQLGQIRRELRMRDIVIARMKQEVGDERFRAIMAELDAAQTGGAASDTGTGEATAGESAGDDFAAEANQ